MSNLSPESKLYPVLFEQYDDQVWLQGLKDIDIGIDKTLPDIDELQSLGLGGGEQGGQIQSGILDSLVRMVKRSEEDYYTWMYPEYSDDIVYNDMVDDQRQKYIDDRIRMQSTDILDFIDGLIQLDRYPKEMFGMYKRLHAIVKAGRNAQEMMRALNQLRIIAMSVVPSQVKFEQVQIVEQSLVSNQRATEG